MSLHPKILAELTFLNPDTMMSQKSQITQIHKSLTCHKCWRIFHKPFALQRHLKTGHGIVHFPHRIKWESQRRIKSGKARRKKIEKYQTEESESESGESNETSESEENVNSSDLCQDSDKEDLKDIFKEDSDSDFFGFCDESDDCSEVEFVKFKEYDIVEEMSQEEIRKHIEKGKKCEFRIGIDDFIKQDLCSDLEKEFGVKVNLDYKPKETEIVELDDEEDNNDVSVANDIEFNHSNVDNDMDVLELQDDDDTNDSFDIDLNYGKNEENDDIDTNNMDLDSSNDMEIIEANNFDITEDDLHHVEEDDDVQELENVDNDNDVDCGSNKSEEEPLVKVNNSEHKVTARDKRIRTNDSEDSVMEMSDKKLEFTEINYHNENDMICID